VIWELVFKPEIPLMWGSTFSSPALNFPSEAEKPDESGLVSCR
jgi:hypothetical protein